MDYLIGSVDSQAILVIAAIAVAILLGNLLVSILKSSFRLILAILAIVLMLQYGFGISTSQLWREIGRLPQDASQLIQGFDLSGIASMFSS